MPMDVSCFGLVVCSLCLCSVIVGSNPDGQRAVREGMPKLICQWARQQRGWQCTI